MTETDAFLAGKPAAEDLAAFQKKMAVRAHEALQGVHAQARPASPEAHVPASLAAPAIAEGVTLQRKGEHEKALAAFDRAIAIDPGNADAYLLKCRSLAGLRRHQDAIVACTESLRLEPDRAEALRDRGHYHLNLGEVDLGLADLQKAESLTHRDRGVYLPPGPGVLPQR